MIRKNMKLFLSIISVLFLLLWFVIFSLVALEIIRLLNNEILRMIKQSFVDISTVLVLKLVELTISITWFSSRSSLKLTTLESFNTGRASTE